MTVTVPTEPASIPDSPDRLPASPLPHDGDYTPDQVADLIERAADLIHEYGLEEGDFWTDALLRPYEPGASCCTAGALAVVCGYRRTPDVEADFVATGHYDGKRNAWVEGERHPVFEALMWELRCTTIEELFDWSDASRDDQVVARLREAAASIRRNGFHPRRVAA